MSTLDQRNAEELAFLTLGFTDVMRRDMDDEETRFLSEKLIRDDTTITDLEPE